MKKKEIFFPFTTHITSDDRLVVSGYNKKTWEIK